MSSGKFGEKGRFAGRGCGTADRLRDGIAAAGIGGLWMTSIGREPRDKGAYLLAIELGVAVRADLPRMGSPLFAPGWYLYAGSARGPGGLAARVNRHFRRDKRLRWHVDRLTVEAADMAALLVPGGDECALVRQLLATGRFETAIRGFGSSDCARCEGHLLAAAPAGGMGADFPAPHPHSDDDEP